MLRFGKYALNIKVGQKRVWWFRPASKISTVVAYILIIILYILHFTS